MAGLTPLLRDPDASAVARVVDREFGTELDRLERAILRAAAGDPAGATDYVETWLRLAGLGVDRARGAQAWPGPSVTRHAPGNAARRAPARRAGRPAARVELGRR